MCFFFTHQIAFQRQTVVHFVVVGEMLKVEDQLHHHP